MTYIVAFEKSSAVSNWEAYDTPEAAKARYFELCADEDVYTVTLCAPLMSSDYVPLSVPEYALAYTELHYPPKNNERKLP